MAADQTTSPPASPSASPTSTTITPPSPDLPSIPLDRTPQPHSNTLIITNLSPTLFTPSSLADIRTIAENTQSLYAFCPIKSLRRIIIVYYSVTTAFASALYIATTPLKTVHDCRIYYGENTPTEESPDRYLHAPKSQKMFFISPPPSPPHGWVSRDEGPPNREVWADDLAKALEGVRAVGKQHKERESGDSGAVRQRRGSRSVVYDPQDHGDSLALPAVMVEDTTEEDASRPGEGDGGGDGEVKSGREEERDRAVIKAHTARPPVELMENAQK